MKIPHHNRHALKSRTLRISPKMCQHGEVRSLSTTFSLHAGLGTGRKNCGAAEKSGTALVHLTTNEGSHMEINQQLYSVHCRFTRTQNEERGNLCWLQVSALTCTYAPDVLPLLATGKSACFGIASEAGKILPIGPCGPWSKKLNSACVGSPLVLWMPGPLHLGQT